MNLYKRFLQPLFFTRRFYWILAGLIAAFIFAYSSPLLFLIARLSTFIFFGFVVVDYILMFANAHAVSASRTVPDRLSNGDESEIRISLTSYFPFRISVKLIDELPVQFQKRDFTLHASLLPKGQHWFTYSIRPTERGEYFFYDLNVFVTGPLGLIVNRFKITAGHLVKVYPSFLSLKKFELVAHSNNLTEQGRRKIRKIGQSIEFEQIREYVTGDDIRSLNWKATARKGGQLMINNYTDERSQQIYCVIDKGRVMKMPFHGLTLLDYAINAALILSHVALLRRDRAGLITFANTIGSVVAADRKSGQMNSILETLYDQQTQFGESNYEKLYSTMRLRAAQRSLVVLFTNFESMSGLQRQLPYIRSIAKNHLVLVVFFENTELRELTTSVVDDIETLYIKTIAEKFAEEKRLMVRELQQHGIFTILTPPEKLTVNTVNKYLELKARQAI